MAATNPQGSNTYVPEVTDKLVVDFSRNIKDFPLNQYVQIVPVKKDVGYYLEITREEAGRILSDGKSNAWADGADRPKHNGETETFEFKAYQSRRYDFGFNVGKKSVDQASWDVIAVNAGIKAEQAMRQRTSKVLTVATTSGNYDSTHTSAVSSISGVSGKWDVSTTARKDIKRSLDYACDLIMQDSLDAVKPEDLILVISRGCARKIAVTQEIVDMIKGSPDALAEVRGELPGRNAFFGLPNKLYGVNVVVENSSKTTSRKGATVAKSGILADTTPFICSRPGGLVSERNSEAPSFATLTLFMYEEMTVEQEVDNWNRKVKHSITEDYAEKMTAPVAGFLFTAAVA